MTAGCVFMLLVGVGFSTVLARHTYIIGGHDAALGAWPWQGSIQFMFGEEHTCGAVIFSKDWILTAAHCVANSPFAYHLIAGLHDRSDWSKGNPTLHYFHSVQKHPDFEMGMYDIAVIKLETSIDLSDEYIGAVDLAPRDATFDNSNCVITGWGATSEGSSDLSNVLQQAEVTVMSNSDCQAALGKDVIFDQHICANKPGERGMCKGDLGGPLVCKDKVGDWKLAGIASWGGPSCSTEKPSVFSRISYFRDWIDWEMRP